MLQRRVGGDTPDIGADHVIDYNKQDFTEGDERYDFILDNVLNHSLDFRSC